MTNTPAPASGSAPVMRGLHNLQTKRQLAIAIGLTAVITVAFKVIVNDPKKKAYAEFYKYVTNYLNFIYIFKFYDCFFFKEL